MVTEVIDVCVIDWLGAAAVAQLLMRQTCTQQAWVQLLLVPM